MKATVHTSVAAQATEDFRPSSLQVWLSAARPKTLPAAAAPVTVGAALAVAAGEASGMATLMALFGALAIQIGTNFVNDGADFAHGADTSERVGPPRAAQRGWLTPEALRSAAAVAFGAATVCGLVLATRVGWPILVVGALSISSGITYTAGHIRYAYRGWGEASVFVFFGPVAVAGTYYANSGVVSEGPVVAGALLGALCSAVLVVNNLRDRHTDTRAGKRTLAVRMGGTAARIEYTVLVLLPFLALGGAVFTGMLPWGALAALGALPAAGLETAAIWRHDGAALNPHLGRTAGVLLAFALLMSGGVLWLR